MKSQFVERTLVMVATAVVLTSLLSAGSLVSGGDSQGYVPVPRTASPTAVGYGDVSLNLGGGTTPEPQVVSSTANIIFGISGG